MRWFWQKKPEPTLFDIGYADPSHEAFNAKLAAARRPSNDAASADLEAPWMKPETLINLPQVNEDFEQSRNQESMFHAQESHKAKAEHQSSTGSGDKEKDSPKPELKPKGALRKHADKAAKEESWLANLRDEVMKKALPLAEQSPEQQPHRRMEIEMK